MKKIVVFLSILLLPSFSVKAGIPVTDIPRLIMEFITQQVLMEQDANVQQAKLLHLLEVLEKVKTIRARHTDVLGIADDLEKELRLVREVEHLKLNDILRISDKVLSVTNTLYARDLPFLEEYLVLKNSLPGLESSNQLHAYFQGGTSVYAELTGQQATGYADNEQLLREQSLKRYGLEVDMARRTLHTALAYRGLAEDLFEQAADLQQQVGKEGRWELEGVGDIFSDLLDGLDGADAGLGGIGNLGAIMGGWADEIKGKVFGGGIMDDLLGEKESKEDQINRLVSEKVGSFDFGSVFGSLLGGIGSFFPVPEYKTEIEKEGMGMTTGERIEAQDAVLDDLEKSLGLQLESDELILKATMKSEHQKRIDASYQNALLRESMAQTQLY